MNMNYIKMFEAIRKGTYTNFQDYITGNDIEKISNWYQLYAFISETSTDNIIDLLYFLHTHENIDVYPTEKYHQVVNEISKKFKFHPEKFFEMLTSFRKLVYGF